MASVIRGGRPLPVLSFKSHFFRDFDGAAEPTSSLVRAAHAARTEVAATLLSAALQTGRPVAISGVHKDLGGQVRLAMTPTVMEVSGSSAAHLAAGGTYVGAQPVRALLAGTCVTCMLFSQKTQAEYKHAQTMR